jgi:GNAT superfamily N-acetyltransferase
MTVASSPETRVVLRPVAATDRDFLVGLYESTRDEELSQVSWPLGGRSAFVRMQFDLQDAQYRMHNPGGSFDVIEADGRPIGRLYVDRRPEDIRVIDIALLPEYRGRGIGANLLGDVLEEAAVTGRTTTVHVEIRNRAAALYARLGFVTLAEQGLHRLMEWRAA